MTYTKLQPNDAGYDVVRSSLAAGVKTCDAYNHNDRHGCTNPDCFNYSPPVSFAVEVIADNSGKWAGNNIRLATEAEAKEYAKDLFARWTLVRETRVVESTDPVNFRFEEGALGDA